jgi:peroxiredoxin
MRGVPKRATFMIDRAGVIQYVDCNDDARVVPDFNILKTKLAELK